MSSSDEGDDLAGFSIMDRTKVYLSASREAGLEYQQMSRALDRSKNDHKVAVKQVETKRHVVARQLFKVIHGNF